MILTERFRGGWLLGAAVAFLSGCGAEEVVDRPKVYPVVGVVMHDNKPVEGATVMFVPQGHSNAAAAITDANGEFKLQTFAENDGAVPGNYKVTVRKIKIGAQADSGRDDAPVGAGGETWLLPKKYGDAGTTDLTATVSESGENKVTLKLTGAAGGAVGGPPANFKGNG
ncbi:hypothetical protein Pan44_54420 [Caulifigura coniformis]|uniref:Carboxypeptidase regulatory-like domain-containing protein n=1 Tax=Caulifigura coniformis TaxID=2527983 RepID=A0A517SMM3_9PLAN|nr:carboxypeptidase-like regulatory domain-containing protein [Caulifigura coniformis]QDT57373.1 hypothetical protein Pan44_54420 [Caulifigura coniformis]